MKISTAIISTALLMIGLSSAHASDHIRIVKCEAARNWKECARITIKGEIQLKDSDEFINRVKEIKIASIDLSSPGGNFIAGLEIGEVVSQRKFKTRILENTSCSSSCAHIWLAGSERLIYAGGILLFHTPFMAEDPNHADGLASVVLGAYLSKLGYSYSFIKDAFGHGPNDINAFIRNEEGELAQVRCLTDNAGDTDIKSCKRIH